jgi:ATP-dependent NAD(P)H-hydrate dehydratase
LFNFQTGADLVYVITTETAAPVIKTYSPDLIVIPYLSKKYTSKISQLLQKMDVVVLGPGLGRDDEEIQLALNTIQTCKNLNKPMVIDADGLYVITTNISILNNYPEPGVILTPNKREATRLMQSIKSNDTQWYSYWGDNVSVLIKGYEDNCYTSVPKFNWSLVGGGSDRRAAGQGDILSGALGVFYNWALKANLCENEQSNQLAKSVAIYAAAKFTRTCNAHAFAENGRNMIASDMIQKIHPAFDEVFF